MAKKAKSVKSVKSVKNKKNKKNKKNPENAKNPASVKDVKGVENPGNAETGEYTLEEIMEEYGAGLERKLTESVEPDAADMPQPSASIPALDPIHPPEPENTPMNPEAAENPETSKNTDQPEQPDKIAPENPDKISAGAPEGGTESKRENPPENPSDAAENQTGIAPENTPEDSETADKPEAGKNPENTPDASDNQTGIAPENTPDATDNQTGSAAEIAADSQAEIGTEEENAARNETDDMPDMPDIPAFVSDMTPLRGRTRKKQTDDAEYARNVPPMSVSLEEARASGADEYEMKNRPGRALFSRLAFRGSDNDHDDHIAHTGREFDPDAAEKAEKIGPEPSLAATAEKFRKEYKRRFDGLPAALAVAAIPLLVSLAEWAGMNPPFLTENLYIRGALFFACLIATGWLCRQVFTDTRCTSAFLCGVSACACACDCVSIFVLSGRTRADCYAAAACLGLIAAKYGIALESRGIYDMFRAASMDPNPPWTVIDTEKGACKQKGDCAGFYTLAMRRNFPAVWQTLILPLVLAASLVFAFLSSAGQDRPADFFLNWSAILAAGATLTLPLCWGLPWGILARRLHKAGCAVAGWYGAEKISRRKKMIVTDRDLFPAGSVNLNGMKLYIENVEKAISYAASMARTSGSGLEKVFDDLLRGESGKYLNTENFRFYQEGGFSAVIEGETVLFGTASFMRRMGQRVPDGLRLNTGMFLAAGTELIAAFALRYTASPNVDYALRMARRSRVTIVLASRDPNITPSLLSRKFRRKIRVEYPSLAARVALSEPGNNNNNNLYPPRAVLLREGLLPYAETVTGSRRLCRGARRATVLGLFGSASGTLLSFYLVFQSRYNLLSPLTLILFLLLWTLPALLTMELI